RAPLLLERAVGRIVGARVEALRELADRTRRRRAAGGPRRERLADVLVELACLRKRLAELFGQLDHRALADLARRPRRRAVRARQQQALDRHLVDELLAGDRHEAE